MKPWLETNPIIKAYNTFMDGERGYNADVGSWQNHINIGGYHWYRYTDLSEVPGLKYANIEDGDVDIFSISQTAYTVYEATDGTLYLVSDDGVHVYKVVDDNGTVVILQITLDEFNAAAANNDLAINYSASIQDFDNDGNLDLVLEPIAGNRARVVIRDLSGDIHTVTRDSLKGHFDSLTSVTDGITGWVYDLQGSSTSIQVKLYDNGKLFATVPVDKARPDINSSEGISGNHGFSYTIPSDTETDRTVKMDAYAVDPVSGAEIYIGTRYFVTVKTGSAGSTVTVNNGTSHTADNVGNYTLHDILTLIKAFRSNNADDYQATHWR